MMPDSESPDTGLLGVLVTFGRPRVLGETLERLAAQTRPLDHLVVVDNGSDPEVRSLVEARQAGSISYLDAGDNLGPAGGYAMGMQHLLEDAGDEDWIFLLDDDDPPFFDDTFEKAERFAAEMIQADPDVGCVGRSGGRFDFSSGRVVRIGDDELSGPVRVDHVTGGGIPAYRVAAVRRVGVPRPGLFFGFEELEYGLRLTRAGYRIYADGDAWLLRRQRKREIGLLPSEQESLRRVSSNTIRVEDPTWRRYYSLRNLILVLRQHERQGTALRVSLTRGILKPLVNVFTAPSKASKHLALNTRAIVDGWRGREGRTLEPR